LAWYSSHAGNNNNKNDDSHFNIKSIKCHAELTYRFQTIISKIYNCLTPQINAAKIKNTWKNTGQHQIDNIADTQRTGCAGIMLLMDGFMHVTQMRLRT